MKKWCVRVRVAHILSKSAMDEGINPITLSFTDRNLETAFRYEAASSAVGVGLAINGIALLLTISYPIWVSAPEPCTVTWPRWCVTGCCTLGFASNLCIGRLGRPAFEHKLLVAAGVVAVLCGQALFVYFSWRDGSLGNSTCMGKKKVEVTDLLLLMALQFMVIVAQQVLAFPFAARITILAGATCTSLICLQLLHMQHAFGENPPEHALKFWFPVMICGEFIGYTLHRMSRLFFLDKQRLTSERVKMDQERQALTLRLEQLNGEKDFAAFEANLVRRELEHTERAFRTYSRTSEAAMGTDLEKSAVPGGGGGPEGSGWRPHQGRAFSATASTQNEEMAELLREMAESHHEAAAATPGQPGSMLSAAFMQRVPETQERSPLFYARESALWRTLKEADLLDSEENGTVASSCGGMREEGADTECTQAEGALSEGAERGGPETSSSEKGAEIPDGVVPRAGGSARFLDGQADLSGQPELRQRRRREEEAAAHATDDPAHLDSSNVQ